MAIFNRRNAVLGWAVWSVAKSTAKSKAKRSVPAANGSKPSWVKRGAMILVGFAAASGAAVMFWRKASSDDLPPPPAE